METRNENLRNGFGRRREQSSDPGHQPQWSGPEENELRSPGRRYGDPNGPESPIDFDQNRGYSDPYRDYQNSPGGSQYGYGYSRRGDYRGNDPEFGYHEPGEPQGSSLFGPTWNQPLESRREAHQRGYPYEESRHNAGHDPRRDNFQRQEFSGPYQSRNYQGSGRGWSQEPGGPDSFLRERAFGYGGGSYGEQPENAPGLNRNRRYREEPPQNGPWSSGSSLSNRPDRGGWNDEGSSRVEPWIEGPHTGRGPKGYQRPDDHIREDVCERLTYHGFIDPSEVDVQVEQGEVRLSGCCTSRREKKMIEDVVDSVRGVHDVSNNISIDRSEQQKSAFSARFSSSDEQSGGNDSRSTPQRKTPKSRKTS